MKKKTICPECEGRGYTTHYATDAAGNKLLAVDIKCANCDGTGIVDVIFTNYDFVKGLDIENMAKFCALNREPYLPHSACYVCEYFEGLYCTKEAPCSEKDQINVYKQWLSQEYKGEE